MIYPGALQLFKELDRPPMSWMCGLATNIYRTDTYTLHRVRFMYGIFTFTYISITINQV